MRTALMVVLLLGGPVAASDGGVRPQCTADADCTVATRCTCDCCPEPEVMTKKAANAERMKCSRMGQCDRTTCGERECRVPPKLQAACVEGRCVAAPKVKPDAGAPDAGQAR